MRAVMRATPKDTPTPTPTAVAFPLSEPHCGIGEGVSSDEVRSDEIEAVVNVDFSPDGTKPKPAA